MHVAEEVLEVDGAQLRLQSFGDSADPCVLLVAGATNARDWWEEALCRRLADGERRVVRYDHRDTGGSTTDPPGSPSYDAAALTSDCAALARHLGPVHLVGMSAGGGIAQAVALGHPELVATLTLVSTSPVGEAAEDLPGPAPEVGVAFEDETPGADWPGWRDATALVDRLVDAERPFTGTLGFDEARVRSIAARVVARSRDLASAENHWSVISDDNDDARLDVRDLDVPTLVVHGSVDPLFPPAHGRALAGSIRGARLLVLEGVGHEYPPPSTWDLLVPALLEHTGRWHGVTSD